jgi:hypothetical protein
LSGGVDWILFQDFIAIAYLAILASLTAVAALIPHDRFPADFNATSITPERIMITYH